MSDSNAQRIKVVVDTDIGTDPDDCLALAYLALHPNCDLLGVTIVTGDVQKRAAVADVLLQACGRRDVPIHLGHRDPLGKGKGQPRVQQYEYMKKREPQLDRPENTAVEFLQQTIRANPNEVVLLTIGPMSNVGALFALDPGIPSMCKEVISMCGYYFDHGEPPQEWNMLVDETAAGIVMKTTRPRHRFVGLDVTRACTIRPTEHVERRVFHDLGKLGAFLQSTSDWWLKKKDRMTFHDPLAAAMVFRPDICQWKQGRVLIDPASGITTLEEGEGTDLVGYAVDHEAFFSHYFEVVKTAMRK